MSLHFTGVSLFNRHELLLEKATLNVEMGEIVSLMGESGIGKSSLLTFLCGLLTPPLRGEGRVWLLGQEITHFPPEKRHLGLLFQDDWLFPHLNVAQNLLFALPKIVESNRQKRLQIIEQALDNIGLGDLQKRMPDALSGGQRARIALLRTLLSRPRALLLDEPFNKLDQTTRQAFRELVFSEAKQNNLPTLLVTHDLQDAAGRVFKLSHQRLIEVTPTP